jgi:hypothetical protein
MPDYLTVIDAGKFWEAPETDIFPLPVVAAALGVGRNRMHHIPVAPIMIAKRKCYRKADILDWALTDDGKALLQELKTKNSSIGRAIKNRSAAWDAIKGFNGPDESKNKEAQIRRLYRELESYKRELRRATWPESEQTAKICGLACVAFKQLSQLKRRKPSRFKYCWWVIDDQEKRSNALKEKYRNDLMERIRYFQSAVHIPGEDMPLDDWHSWVAENLNDCELELKKLDGLIV